MICNSCNRQIPDNSIYCPECGAPVTAASEEKNNASEVSSPYGFSDYSQNPGGTTYNGGLGGTPSSNIDGDPTKDGYSVASLVISLVGLFTCCCGLPINIVSLIFGIIGTKSTKKGMAIAGIVISVICLVAVLFLVIGYISFIVSFTGEMTEAMPDIYNEFYDEFFEGFNMYY